MSYCKVNMERQHGLKDASNHLLRVVVVVIIASNITVVRVILGKTDETLSSNVLHTSNTCVRVCIVTHNQLFIL